VVGFIINKFSFGIFVLLIFEVFSLYLEAIFKFGDFYQAKFHDLPKELNLINFHHPLLPKTYDCT
jgi:hypothetical protein